MFIAAKYEEIYPPNVSEFVYMTKDTYTKQQVGIILRASSCGSLLIRIVKNVSITIIGVVPTVL